MATPRERILATLHHKRPDRIPTDGWFHPEVVVSLKGHFQTEDGRLPEATGEEGIERARLVADWCRGKTA